MRQMWEIKSAIEEAIHGLGLAEKYLAEVAGECDGGWAEINDLCDKVSAVKREADKLIPLHPSIEAEIERREEEADRYGDWLASGNLPHGFC